MNAARRVGVCQHKFAYLCIKQGVEDEAASLSSALKQEI
jgi:hypothetical protein